MFDTSNCAGFTVETCAAALGVAWPVCDWRDRKDKISVSDSDIMQVNLNPLNICFHTQACRFQNTFVSALN